MTAASTPGGVRTGPDRRVVAGVVAAGLLFVVGVTWAKWWPYVVKADGLADSRSWDGGALLDVARDAPSWWVGSWEFTVTYTEAVWKALLVGLLLAAAIDTLLPRRRIARLLSSHGSAGGAALAGAASPPSMMCTCCASPVAVSLRRSGTPLPAVVAYWLGNPVLNPAVLIFLALVGPWQWGVTRLVVGVILVLGAAHLAARLSPARRAAALESEVEAAAEEPTTGPSLARFVRSFLRFTVTLVPEYLGVIMLVGAAAHLLPGDTGWPTGGALALIVLAALAVLMVIPTGGEIPVLLALAASGAGPWALGLILIALPAVSLPSLIMVGRSLTWRVTAGTVGAVVVSGALAGAMLALTS